MYRNRRNGGLGLREFMCPRKLLGRHVGLPLLVLLLVSPALGQMAPRLEQPAPPSILQKVGIDQKLGDAIPLDARFRDENGKEVQLSEYFGKRPVALALVYYECPMLCTLTLNGMVRSFRPLKFEIGQDFEVVTISFDPRETSVLAAAKKAKYLENYGRSSAASGWHFLTGDQASIDRITQAVGFRYTWDEQTKQFAHSTALILLTPDGHVSRYLYGLEYAPKDVRFGLIEASENKIGSLADQFLLLCYHYDPMTGRYGFLVSGALKIGGGLTVLAIGLFVTVMLIRERRAKAGAIKTDRPQMRTN